MGSTLFQCNIKGILPKAIVLILISKKLGIKILHDGKLVTPASIIDKNKLEIRNSSVKAVLILDLSSNPS